MKKIGGFVVTLAICLALCGCTLSQISGKTASASAAPTVQASASALATTTSIYKESTATPDAATATPDAATATPDAATATPDAATATPKSTATPAPTAAAAPAVKSVKVSYESSTVVINGLNAAGATQWTRKIAVKDETELDPYSRATIQDGVVYLQADYKMVALSGDTGKTLWVSSLSGGLCMPIVKNGVVYTCSYYGEPLVGLSAKKGTTLFIAKMTDDSFYWAYSLNFKGSTIVVHFEAAGPDQSDGTAVFDLKGKLISKKVGK